MILAKDLDIFLVAGDQDLSGTVLDSSQGVTTTESVILPSQMKMGFLAFTCMNITLITLVNTI